MRITTSIQQQYACPQLFQAIANCLKAMGVDLENISRTHLAPVDEFHVRGAAVSMELAGLINLDGARVLDVGCGIGGPCRMLAEVYGCEVTGIDISRDFIETAKGLTRLVGLEERIQFLQADATHLPFEDDSFDVVWTQHVQMNVEDKAAFYSEIQRVLRKPGTFIYYDIFKKGDGKIAYPVPWADHPGISFLSTTEAMATLLGQLDMEQSHTADETAPAILFFEKVLKKMAESGMPPLGLHLIMGEETEQKLRNVLEGLKRGGVMLQRGVYSC